MADGAAVSEMASQRFTSAQIAEALGVVRRSVDRIAGRECWRFTEEATRGGQRRLYALADLPTPVQAALVRKHALANTAEAPPRRGRREKLAPSEARIQSAWARYERSPDTQKAIAASRQAAVTAVEHLVQQGLGRMAAREAVVAELVAKGERAASLASLMRWEALVARAPRSAWRALLLPEFTGRPSLKDIPQEAWDVFKADYLRPSAPSATGCYERLQRIAKARGWVIPALRTFERRIVRELPHAVRVLARQGEDALAKLYPAQERDHGVFHALEAVNSDGHKFDVFVRFPNGEVGRPVLVGVQDIYSGKLLGFRIGETETAALARLAFADVVRDFGIPKHTYLDNGRGFASKLLTGGTANRFRFKVKAEDPVGVLTGLGIEVHWVLPYSGQSKPIERAWRDLCDRIAKHPACEGAYTGNKPDAKPENYGSRAVEWEAFCSVVRQEIAAHNAREGRSSPVCAGRSFDRVFAESYSKSQIAKPSAEQLRTLLLASEVVTTGRDGSVHIAGNRYWTEALTQHIGSKVILRFDPDHLHQPVSVYSLAGVFIADADYKTGVGFADAAAASEHKRGKAQHRRAAKDMLKAERRMTAAQVAAQLPDVQAGELPAPGIIEGIFGRQQLTVSAEAQPLQRTGTDDVDHGVLDGFLERLAKQRGLVKEAD